MATFNVTEQEIIDGLKAKGAYHFSTCSGRKATGGRCDFPNTRRVNAAARLRDLGLVVIEHDKWQETARGYSMGGHDCSVRPTEKFLELFPK